MANVLIASLGESPIVVTAMYDLLTTQEKIQEIEKVVILHPQGDMVRLGYDLIEDALKDKCKLDPWILPFNDANGEEESYTFLRTLFQLLSIHQQSGDSVYLSLAGGRKNMSALMALLAPIFSCVIKLYHVLDLDERKNKYKFLSVEELYLELSETERKLAMHPNLERLILVDIPYGEKQRVKNDFRSRLFTLTDDELDDLWDEDPELAEVTEFYRPLTQQQVIRRFLNVEVTEHVKDEFLRMQQQNAPQAERFATCFKQMKDPYRLRNALHASGFSRDSFSFHFYKRRRTRERPFYHTEPQSIHFFPTATVEKVIISGMSIEQPDGSYKPTGKELLPLPLKPTVAVDALLSLGESILLVPLGLYPMVATQLYTLLKDQGRTIREVILVYPRGSREVRNGAELVKKAFQDEDVKCREVGIEGLKDINSRDACERYERELEETIDKMRQDNPVCQIELALSGGRKGMAALAMFVAQRKHIRYVYHTLINNDKLSQQVEDETTVSALDGVKVDKKERNDRLFLRAYEKQKEKIVLFKVPVLPAGGS